MAQVAAISQQIWDMKYRLKALDGAPVDKTIEDSWRRVADALAEGAALAAAFVDGQRGHPVGFAARWRRELLALTGDEGARAVIGGNKGLLRRIETTDPGVLQDVDRPGDIPP